MFNYRSASRFIVIFTILVTLTAVVAAGNTSHLASFLEFFGYTPTPQNSTQIERANSDHGLAKFAAADKWFGVEPTEPMFFAGETAYDSFSDGDFTSSPVWGGNTANWTIVANSDAAAGATGSNTIRLNAPAVSQTDYLSSQISSWGTSQEWGFWIGRRAQAFSATNQQYVWLYANESTLNNATVDGYRIAIGDDTLGDEIRLEYVVNGAVISTVITSSGSVTNAITDVGFLVRVTRSSTGVWQIFTSTLPTTTGTGAIATATPNFESAAISQGTGTNNALVPASNGYLGIAALHSTGANAIIAAEFDQFYFTTPLPTPTLGNYAATATSVSGNTTVTPDAAPANTTSISVSAPAGFKGILSANTATGVVRVTNATLAKIPAGVYPVTVTAFGSSGSTTTKTFDLTISPTACVGTSSFVTSAPYTVGTTPQSVAVGDFNEDGKQDLIVANSGSNSIVRYTGSGTGTFSSAGSYSTGTWPMVVAVGDFNNDGKDDAVTSNNSSNNVSVLIGTGTGAFAAPVNYAVGTAPYAVGVGDFNGDGKLDLAAANGNSANISILLGTGTGSFGAATNFPTGTTPNSITVGDFNGDGKQDLAVANRNSNTVSIFIGNGAGSFAAKVDFAVGTSPFTTSLGDFDGDGDQDIVTANQGSSNLSVLIGDGAGSFAAATNFTVGVSPYFVTVGDVNGDGKQDLATANFSSSNVSVLTGDGTGSFGGLTNYTVGSNPGSITLGDFNADGYQDFAVTNSTSANISVGLGACALPNTTVTFNANGGTGSMANQITNTPTALTTNSFTRTGYTFSGWNTAANGSGTAYANGATYPFTASATLYAIWTPTLTAAVGATVDGAFNVTFTDDPTWRAAITGITIGGTPLTGGYTVSAGQITFTPSASNPANLLQDKGTKSIAIQATGFVDASVSQFVEHGAVASLTFGSLPSSPTTGSLSTIFGVAANDQYNNSCSTNSTTVITMTSTSGNVQFDTNLDGTTGDNSRALSSGSLSLRILNNIAETTTITATADNGSTGTSGNITWTDATVSTDHFRSRVTGQSWTTADTWESSHTGSAPWFTATSAPTTAANTVTIRNGHTVSILGAVTLDQLVIESGGVLNYTNTVLTIANGAGDDITIQSGGVFNLANSTIPTFSSGATVSVETGGIVRVSATSGLIGLGTGVNSSNFVYKNASILDINAAYNITTSNVVFFPNVDANTIPIFRVSVNGAGFNAAGTVNGVVEVNGSFGTTNAGTRIFRNGIRGSAALTQNSGSGPIQITGATAELGGAGAITALTNGIVIASGSVTTLISNKTINGPSTTNTLTVNGTLNCGTNVLSGTSAFTLSTTGTLGVGSPNGVTTSPTASGNIQTTGRNYNAGTYNYNGTAAQVTGSGLALSTSSKLSVTNTSGLVTLSQATSVGASSIGSGASFSTGAFTLTVTFGITLTNNGTFTVASGGGTSAVAGTLANSGTMQVNGTLQFNTGGSFSGSAPSYGSSSALNYATVSTHNRGSEWTQDATSQPGYPNNVNIVGTLNLVNGATTSAFGMSGNLTGNILSLSTLSQPFTVGGDISLSQITNSAISGGDLKVGGNLLISTYTHNGRTLEFNGSSAAQTWAGSGGLQDFGNVKINNPLGVTLSNPLRVQTLDLTSGLVNTTSTNVLTVLNSSAGAITGGSTSSFINGPLNRTLPANLSSDAGVYAFPVGQPFNYLPATMTNLTTGATGPVLQMYAVAASAGGSPDGTTVTSLDPSQYWVLTGVSGNDSNGNISLARQTPVSPNTLIATGQLSSSFSSIGGTASGNSINNGVTGTIQASTSRAYTFGQRQTYQLTTVVSPVAGGTISAPATNPTTVNHAAPTTITAVANPGYTFTGWTLGPDNSAGYFGDANALSTTVTLVGDATATANFAVANNTVTFNANGGSGSMANQTTNLPTALTLNSFTRVGYTFAGWGTAPGGPVVYADGATYPFTANITLFAQWTVASQTLTFNSNGGSAVTAITQDFGTAVTAPADPTRSGFTFGGWYDDDITFSTPHTFSTMGLSTTVYAKWNDSQAPSITFTPIANSATDTARTVTVTVADNVGVTAVSIYSAIGNGAYSSTSCVLTVSPNYDCTIPAPGLGSAVQYYVSASDAASNTSYDPSAAIPNVYTIGGAAIPAGTYSNVSLAGGSTLAGDVTVEGVMDLGGVVTGGSNTLTLDCDTTVTGAGSTAYVDGAVKKNFCATSGTPFSYPVGTGGYTPVDVTVTVLTTNPSSLTVTTTDATLNGFQPEQSLSRYWDLTETGDLTATISFTYLPADVNGTVADYRVWRKEGSNVPTNECPSGPCVTVASNVIGPVVGVSQFSKWTGAAGGALAPTASDVSVAGRVLTADGRGIRNAEVTVSGNSLPVPLRALTGAFGYYQIDGLEAGETYVLTVGSKRFTFTQPSRVVSLTDNLMDADFVANP